MPGVAFVFAALAVPLGLLLTASWLTLRVIEQEAFTRAQKTAEVLSEHALRTFRSHELIIDMVNAYVRGSESGPAIRSDRLDSILRTFGRKHEDINRIALLSIDGVHSISSNGSVGSADLELTGLLNEVDFPMLLKERNPLIISATPAEHQRGERSFKIAKPWFGSEGAFGGITMVSANPGYFESFYSGILESAKGSAALIRADGVFLAQVPLRKELTMLPFGSPLFKAMKAQSRAGIFSDQAALDGEERLYAYRRVGDYPLYVSFALSKTVLWDAWTRRMLPYAVLCVGAAALLLIAAFFTERRMRGERIALKQWAQESGRRIHAEEQVRYKDDFIAVLGHELRNPISAIGLSAELIKRGAQNPQTASALAVINRQVKQLRRLVDDMLQLAALAHGKLDLRPQPVDLLEAARKIDVASLNHSGRAVALEIDGESVWAKVDPARIEQMLSNLVENAAKYGGSKINISVSNCDGRAQISVQDDGQGVDAQLLSKMFEPFVQGRQSLNHPQGGLGLGLAVVRELALGHGGALSAHSAGVGKGSTFTLTLPLADPPATQQSHPSESNDVSRLRVLVVEDDADERESLRQLLELEGHDVMIATNGVQALECCASFKPEIAFVDRGLPGMGGLEFARRARQTELGNRMMLIALTGYGREQDRRESLEAGFDVHLTKPVSVDELHQAVRSVGRCALRCAAVL